MQLTRYTDYGLRLLLYLALQPEKQLSSIETICTAYGLSRNHLHKIAHQLGQAGVLETVRGKGGGIRLAQKPEQLNLGRLVRFLEGDLDTVINCYSPACQILPACQLKGVMAQATRAFLQVLDQYTLADTLDNAQELRALLSARAPAPATIEMAVHRSS